MCYKTALTLKKHVQEYFNKDFEFPEKYEPYYLQSGFTHPRLQIKMDEPQKIYPATWGYVPGWGMENVPSFRKKSNTLNIKSKTLFTGISREAGYQNRCLIIADGFFEPHKIAGTSIPYFCFMPSQVFPDGRHLFAFGGIYSESKTPDQLTCSILTMEANPFFSEVHNVKKRQPFVIEEELYDEWLHPNLSKENVMELIDNGFTSREFRAYPVNGDLYKRNIHTNNPSILEKIPPPNLMF